jgi:hypothetical protein
VETATDIYPLTAYCEHPDCIEDSFYTYRYYRVGDLECPALYFDPLIIVGGDRVKEDPREPNYCTRCDAHHFRPGKEYSYFVLKPLGRRPPGAIRSAGAGAGGHEGRSGNGRSCTPLSSGTTLTGKTRSPRT